MKRVLDAAWRVGLRVAWAGATVWFRVRRPHLRAACVLVEHRGQILVLESSYRDEPALPGGFLKRGEEPIPGAIRELGEEIGLRVSANALRPLGANDHLEFGATITVHLFHLPCPTPPDLRLDEREIIAAEFQTPARAAESLTYHREAITRYAADWNANA